MPSTQAGVPVNRLRYAAAAIFMQVLLGVIYRWSIFRGPLAELHGWSKAETLAPYRYSMLAFAAGMIVAGFWQDRKGPRLVASVGGFLLGTGVCWRRGLVTQWVGWCWPTRPGSQDRRELSPGVRTYHLFFSRESARSDLGVVGKPRHFLVYRRREDVIEVVRVLHYTRELVRHLPSDQLRNREMPGVDED